MSLIQAHQEILRIGQPIFQTGDVAARLGITHNNASQMLLRLARTAHVMRLRRGIWALPSGWDRLALPRALTAPFPSYVSLQSALYHHGMISQVPNVIYAVSPARTRRFDTPLGVVSIHHLQPSFFFGYAPLRDQDVLMAEPEKALLDLLYLTPAKSRLFRHLPELEIPRRFSRSKLRGMLQRVRSPRRRTLVARRIEQLGL